MKTKSEKHSIKGINVNVIDASGNWLVKHSTSGMLQISKTVAPKVKSALKFYWEKVLKGHLRQNK